MIKTVAIVVRGHNDFDVVVDGRISDRLCWNEMLGQVVHLTHYKIVEARYKMLAGDEIAAERKKWGEDPLADAVERALLGQKSGIQQPEFMVQAIALLRRHSYTEAADVLEKATAA